VTAIFYPQKQMWVWVARLPLWLLAALYLLADLSGLLRGGTGIAHGGHLGGAAAGATFWWLDLRLFASPGQSEPERQGWPSLLTRLRMAWRWRWRPALLRAEPAAAAPAPRANVDFETAARVDELLAKISQGGMASLSPEELEFLKQASGRYRADA